MKQRADKCHIMINPDFLFDLNKRFKSIYTPWIYICIKLADVRKTGFEPEKFFKIDRKLICELLQINTATITRAIKELVGLGLIEQRNREYRIIKEKYKSVFEKVEGFPVYIEMYNNFLIDFFGRLNHSCNDIEKKDRSIIKTAEVFFYLIAKNKHCIVNVPILSSEETSKTISKYLHHDEAYIKSYLDILESIGKIEIDSNGIIKTVYSYGSCDPFRTVQKERTKIEQRVNSDSSYYDTFDFNDYYLTEESSFPINKPPKKSCKESMSSLDLLVGSDLKKLARLIVENKIRVSEINNYYENNPEKRDAVFTELFNMTI